MNKKEIAEIKKQFKLCNDRMVINRIACYYIKENEVLSSFIKKFAGEETMENTKAYVAGNDALQYLEIAKKTLNGQIGKGITEYAFPSNQLKDKESPRGRLISIVNNGLEDEEFVTDYVKFIAGKYDRMEYVVIIQHCTYSVPEVSGGEDDNESGDEEYSFVVISLCPLEAPKPELACFSETNEITSSENAEKIVGKPSDGFLFPAFNDRSMDPNNVLIFNRTPKEPNKVLIEEILGCEFIMGAEEEKEKFNSLLTKIATSDSPEDVAVDYSVTQSIHSQITDMIKKNSVESETPVLSSHEIKMILRRSGIEEDKLKNFEDIYDDEIGEDVSLKAVNIINPDRLGIKSPDIVINVKPEKTDRVVSRIIDGERCLVVRMDENVEINGLDVTVK